MASIQKIVPCLWFDNQAEDAAKFYTSVFENSRLMDTTHYGTEGQEVHGQKPGTVMTVAFELDGVHLGADPIFTRPLHEEWPRSVVGVA